jgi:membrane protein
VGGEPGRNEELSQRSLVRRAQAAAAHRIEYWRQSRLARRLRAADLINQGLLLAAVLLLCFLPFLLVIGSVTGSGDESSFIRRFGLSSEAAHAVRQALTAPVAPSTSVSGLSWVFFVLFGMAAAGAIEDLYERVFGVQGRGLRDAPRRVVWLAAALGVSFAGAWTQPWLAQVGGPGLVAIAALPVATAFWWFSMWLLLGGRMGWRELFPSALATGVCWLGMVIVFRLTLSSTIVSDYRKYGPAGVVFALMPLLIAIGVVVVLGAILGVAWRERHEHPLGEQPKSSTEPGRLSPQTANDTADRSHRARGRRRRARALARRLDVPHRCDVLAQRNGHAGRDDRSEPCLPERDGRCTRTPVNVHARTTVSNLNVCPRRSADAASPA